jgi:serine/threonine-protein kinase
MLDRKGRVAILDFGVAKAITVRGGTISVTGEVVGTAEYMSPEQAQGITEVDHRCDVYSLGVLGWEMLAGEVPFVGDTVHDTLAMHVKQPIPDVRGNRPDTPPAFASALRRCMAKEPDGRWPDAVAAARAAGADI